MHGILRSVDELGRIVLPSNMRNQIGLPYGDKLDVTVFDSYIILTKVIPACIFCNAAKSARS